MFLLPEQDFLAGCTTASIEWFQFPWLSEENLFKNNLYDSSILSFSHVKLSIKDEYIEKIELTFT